jgi:hypothetical protein
MVPIIYAISIVLAIYPNSVLPFWRREAEKRRPAAAYALSGVAAAIAAFVVSLLFRFTFDSDGSVIAVFRPRARSSGHGTSLDRTTGVGAGVGMSSGRKKGECQHEPRLFFYVRLSRLLNFDSA